MIIMGLLNVVTFLLTFVFGAVAPYIPPIGEDVTNILNNFMNILDMGVDLFCFLLGPVASILVAYIIGFQIVKSFWDLIWFVIRKIPMLNIRE